MSSWFNAWHAYRIFHLWEKFHISDALWSYRSCIEEIYNYGAIYYIICNQTQMWSIQEKRDVQQSLDILEFCQIPDKEIQHSISILIFGCTVFLQSFLSWSQKNIGEYVCRGWIWRGAIIAGSKFVSLAYWAQLLTSFCFLQQERIIKSSKENRKCQSFFFFILWLQINNRVTLFINIITVPNR